MQLVKGVMATLNYSAMSYNVKCVTQFAHLDSSYEVLRNFRLALIQLHVSAVKTDNLNRACRLVRIAAGQGAKIVILPECFNCPYGTKYFPEYAEKIPGDCTHKLSEIAKECGIYLIGELSSILKQIHLFDINVPGKIQFQESETLSAGDRFSVLDTCCKLLVYPGAFNLTTGPAHWELLQRGRAVDNQIYVATASPARDETGSYVAWGHSTVVNPWGEVIAKAGTEETIVHAEIDLKKAEEIREQIPILSQKRSDLYTVEAKIV
ncbi:hypothetical protein Chor_000334 [Crotalus horridus]